jgi:membrane protein YdbS with pleckstrin-like domain
MIYERRHQPLAPSRVFLRRVVTMAIVAAALLAMALAIGMIGYRVLAHMRWIDALLNASMILGGMGPVDPLPNDKSKVFASAYALFAGVVFLVSIGVLVSPLVHRTLHRFHLDERDVAAPKRNAQGH